MPKPIHEATVQDETARLGALYELDLMDTPVDPDIDQLVETMIATLRYPVGFVSLIDKDRQWFKSMIGTDFTETPRAIALCDHTIRDDLPLIVEDALLDPRFRENPLVVGEPHLRAYAGTPVRTPDGYRVGTICIADMQPRKISDEDQIVLNRFAGILERMLASIALSKKTEAMAAELERKAARAADLKQQARRLETSAALGHWSLDLETGKLSWSEGIFRLHGLKGDSEPDLERALQFYPEADRAHISECLEITRHTGRPFETKAAFTDATGHSRWVRIRGERTTSPAGAKTIAGIFQDISEFQDTRDQLRQATTLDLVTGVHNSQSFEKELAHWIAASGDQSFGIAIIGVPGISTVRQSYGRGLTDVMLREIANTLKVELEDGEFLARTSYEGFTILSRSQTRTEELRARIVETFENLKRKVAILRRRIDIEPRCAVAIYPHHGQTADRLIRSAELALRVAYENDSTADGSIVFFSQEMQSRFEVRENAAGVMQSALDEDRLVPFFQPIVRLSDGRITAFEALVRIRMDDGTITGPADFWPALLDPGLSRKVGFIMRDAIIEQLARWQQTGECAPSISLNAGTSDLSEDGMQMDLLDRLRAANVRPDLLKLEVTENVLLSERGSPLNERIQHFRKHGIRTSLDDFGTGFGTLTNLLSFPADEVKIDKSFIGSIDTDPDKCAISRSILKMATDLKMDSVSEGVETAAQLRFVTDHGSTHAQGFLLAHPMPEDAATELLEAGPMNLSFPTASPAR